MKTITIFRMFLPVACAALSCAGDAQKPMPPSGGHGGNAAGRVLQLTANLAATQLNVRYVFKSGTKLQLFGNGLVKEGVLAERAVLTRGSAAFTLADNSVVSFDESGNCLSGTLARDVKIAVAGYEILLHGGTPVLFFENGLVRSATASCDREIKWGKNAFRLRKSSRIFLHPRGLFAGITLTGNTDFKVKDDVIPLKAGNDASQVDVAFHENGNVSAGILSRDTYVTLGDKQINFAKDMPVVFYPDGKLKEACMVIDTLLKIGEHFIKVKALAKTIFYPDHAIRTAVLAEDTIINGKSYKSGEELEFDENGVFMARLSGRIPNK